MEDAGGETALASLVHNPACLKALKSFFSCKPARSASRKLPRGNPYRMTSSLKSTRGRHSLRPFNPHNIENLLSSSNVSTADTSSSKVTEATVSSGTNQIPSEVVMPPSLPEDATSIANMVDQLVRKHVKEEIFGNNNEKQVTSSPPAAKPVQPANSITSVNINDVNVGTFNTEHEDGVATISGRLSPLFPNLTAGEDPKSQEDKTTASHTHTSSIDVLLSLTSNWPLIVTSILGRCLPSCGEEPRGIPSDGDNSLRGEYSSQACDYFIQDLLYNCDYAVAESVADTIIAQLNDGFALDKWTLDDVLQLEDDSVVVTEANVALIVGKKFLHSLVRLLAMELSDPVIGGEEASERVNKNKSVIVLIQ